MSIVYLQASGEDIERIVEKIETILNEERKDHVMMACLSISIILQQPQISTEMLVEGVKGASEWISCFLAETSEDGTTATIAPSRVN